MIEFNDIFTRSLSVKLCVMILELNSEEFEYIIRLFSWRLIVCEIRIWWIEESRLWSWAEWANFGIEDWSILKKK